MSLLALAVLALPESRNSDIHLSIKRSTSPNTNQSPWHPVYLSTVMFLPSVTASFAALHLGHGMVLPFVSVNLLVLLHSS